MSITGTLRLMEKQEALLPGQVNWLEKWKGRLGEGKLRHRISRILKKRMLPEKVYTYGTYVEPRYSAASERRQGGIVQDIMDTIGRRNK